MRNYAVIIMLSAALAACNGEKDSGLDQNQGSFMAPKTLSGAYTAGKDALVFSVDGKVVARHPHFSDQVTTYIVEGGKVKFTFPQGYPSTLVINSDGSLTSDSNTKFKKAD